MHNNEYKHNGFTIVELLVVIVVIGILAAITIVSYTGISDRASKASLQSDMANAVKQLKLYQVLYGSYPTSLNSNNCPEAPDVDNNFCLKSSSGNPYTYDVNNDLDTPVFYLKNNNGNNVAALEDGSINMAVNSDFENNKDSYNDIPDDWSGLIVWSGATGTASIDSTNTIHGIAAYNLNKTNASGQVYVSQNINTSPVNTYTYSCWVKSSTTAANIDVGHDSTWSNSFVPSNKLNQWTRLSVTFSNTTTSTITLRLGVYGGQGTATFDYCQLVKGPNPFS
jgi:prepilin-type N-terminal cleavage/methylation domain-containing protein